MFKQIKKIGKEETEKGKKKTIGGNKRKHDHSRSRTVFLVA